VDVAIVNWNSGKFLRQVLESLGKVREDVYQLGCVAVVDNSSTDDSMMDLPTLGGRVSLDRAEENLGFARGCNRGARKGSGDYILFLNPDTLLPNGAISTCVTFMEMRANNQVGICGVRLVDELGNSAVCAARFPNLYDFASKALGLCELFPNRFPPYVLPAGEPLQSGFVDQIIGAFFFVRRSVFAQCGGFDERFFLYFEELDFSLRARALGQLSFFLAEEKVFHKGGVSSEQVKDLRLAYSWRSRIAYGAKHFSTLELVGLILITTLVEPVTRIARALLICRFSEAAHTIKAWSYLLFGTPGVRRTRP
jgi:GT2 family glycosyltransferase